MVEENAAWEGKMPQHNFTRHTFFLPERKEFQKMQKNKKRKFLIKKNKQDERQVNLTMWKTNF